MRYTLDANSISAIISDNIFIKNRVEISLLSGDTITVNAISYYEVKRGLLCKDTKNQLINFIKLCREHDIIIMDKISIFDKASEIYARLGEKKEIGDCDILIASIACIGDFTLVTNNIRHFNIIRESTKELNVENWLN